MKNTFQTMTWCVELNVISIVLILYHLNGRNIFKISYLCSTLPPISIRVPFQNLPCACPMFHLKFPLMILLRKSCMMIPSHPRSMSFQEYIPISFLSLRLFWMRKYFGSSLTTTRSSL